MAIETKRIIDHSPTTDQESYFALSKIDLLEKDHAKVSELIGSIRRLAKLTGRLSNYIYEAELNQLLEDRQPIDLEKKYFMDLAQNETSPRDLRKSYIGYMKAKMEFVRKVMKLYARLNRDYISSQKKPQTPKKRNKRVPKTKKMPEKQPQQATLLSWS